ncbi:MULTISPECIES: hypothetical protein [Streptomyces]|nr:hypothetical protein [Streptomyces sp. NBRC 13847]
MAQTIAKRTITWGLVTLPVSVHAATERPGRPPAPGARRRA